MSDNSKPKNNQPTIRRKTGVIKLPLKSETMFRYLSSPTGDIANNALLRIGELLLMAQRRRNMDIFEDIQTWYTQTVLEGAQKNIESLEAQAEVLSEETMIEFDDFKSPEMIIEFNIIHPSHHAYIKLIQRLDTVVDEIESHILAGAGESSDTNSMRNQVYQIIRSISDLIFKVTKPGKRDGGPFKTDYFIEQLKNGVFSLYPDIADHVASNEPHENVAAPEESVKDPKNDNIVSNINSVSEIKEAV